MTEREALKLALEALELHLTHHEHGCVYLDPAVTAIKEALAQPEKESVACVEYIPCCTDQTCPKCKAAIKPELVCVCGAVWEGQELIYTTPQRTWVGLTEEELYEIYNKANWDVRQSWDYERAIEAKLKAKNT